MDFIVNQPLMPKGVEHEIARAKIPLPFRVNQPLMPKGVEHLLAVLVLLFCTREPTSDAERR